MKKVINKEDLIKLCMDLLKISVYSEQSTVYQRVEKALRKLNNIELDSLYVMILSRRTTSNE